LETKAPQRISGTDFTKQTLRIFWRHARKYRYLFAMCAAGVAVVIGADMTLPMFYKRFFDCLAIDPFHRQLRDLAGVYSAITYVGLTLLASWIGWRVTMYALINLETRAMKDLADSSFEYLQNHSHKFFTLVKRINRFGTSFEVVMDQLVMEIGQTAIRVILVVGIIFWRNRTLGLIFCVWAMVFIGFNIYFSRWKLKYDLIRAEFDTKITARLADTVANAINLKLFAGIKREVHNFQEITDQHRQARYRSWMLGNLSDSLQGLSIRGLEIIVLVVAVRYWYIGQLTLGDFVFLRSYLGQLTENVRQMGGDIRRIYEAMADANEMTEILLKPHDLTDKENAATLAAPRGAVEFRDVQFAYVGGGHMILQDFNLKIGAGERVGIVGPSGGGKSTILKLLTRLHDVTGGEILIDKQNIAFVTQDSLHQKLAYVPQDPILFHRSLMDNIRYSRPDATDDEVIRAAKLAHCHEFISSFPDGYQTFVGERGVKLSGGERQRVAIARAILMDAPILILDEATSSLDSESEIYIQDSLARLIVGRTVIAVAHRLSTIRKMDRIVVVKDGHIIEAGSHDLLLKIQDGMYQRLWNLQSTDFSIPIEKGKYLQ